MALRGYESGYEDLTFGFESFHFVLLEGAGAGMGHI